MEIKLNKLTIMNFQSIKEFMFEPNGKNLEVHGDNATGKTTLKNSFNWVLFNKNSKGNTKFSFKPLDAAGNPIHGLETSVEVEFIVDGVIRTFKRIVLEKKSTVRGTNSQSYKDVASWLVDGVPKKKGEYEQEISKIIDEDIFKMITDPLYFNTQLKWDERRNILMSISGDIADADIISSNAELKPLNDLLEGMKVDDFKEKTKYQMKPVHDALNKIPVQIAEAERAMPNNDDVEFDETSRQLVSVMLEQKESDLSSILNGAEVINVKSVINEYQREITHFTSLLNAPISTIDELKEDFAKVVEVKANKEEIARTINDNNTSITSINRKLEINQIERQKLSKEWDAIFDKEFTGNVCPTCKRELPEDEVEAHKKEFNINKANELDVVEAKLKVLNDEKTSLNDEVEKLKESISIGTNKISELDKEYLELYNVLNTRYDDYKTSIQIKIDEIDKNIDIARKKLIDIENNSADIVEKLKSDIAKLKEEKNEYDVKISNKELIKKQTERIEELKRDEKRYAAELEELQNRMYLCELFTRVKAELLTERINSNFKLAKFKLFEIQKNEGIKETCEVTFDGVPFNDLNNAMTINIGLDIINTLCNKYEVTAPIIVDNAEAVTTMFDTASQQIRLVVDKDCKKLTII